MSAENRMDEERNAALQAETEETGAARRLGWRGREAPVICMLLGALVLIVFGQTMRHGFTNYDDNMYVYDNPDVMAPLSAGRLLGTFTRKVGGLWNPLISISHMADYQWYGLWAGGHHLTNVLLHMASVMVLFLALRQMTGALWRSAFVAAVFAIHPLQVESVAWISERKDVLSGFFFMLTLWSYGRYVRKPESRWNYAWMIVFFALGLMAKSMVVTLPVVLLLLDYWPLRRLFAEPSQAAGETGSVRIQWRVLIEKAPLFVCSLAGILITLPARVRLNGINIEVIPYWTRLGDAPVWVMTYLRQFFWPANLAVIYTHPERSAAWWPFALAVIAVITTACYMARKRHPYLLTGWLWNIVMLGPVIGIIQISRHAQADHYNYLPLIGVYMGLTWFLANWAAGVWWRRIALGSAALVAMPALLITAFRQTAYWRDNVTLWTHTLAVTQDNYIAHMNLGDSLSAEGRLDDAIAQFRETLKIQPKVPQAHYDIGNCLKTRGDIDGAIVEYRAALKLASRNADARNNLGDALSRQGKKDEAIEEFRKSIILKPGHFEAQNNLGNALQKEGRVDEAIEHFRQALQIKPDFAEAHYNLGNALKLKGQTGDAIEQYHEALRLKPCHAQAHNNLGMALCSQGQWQEGMMHYREAYRINPGYADARNNLALALQARGDLASAITQYRQALRINPGSAEAHNNLGYALFQQGSVNEAIGEYQQALQIKPDFAEAHYNLGGVLLALGKLDEAIGEYRQAIKVKEEYAQAHYNLSVALQGKGELKEAIEEMKTAVELSPGDVMMENNVAWMLATIEPAALRDGAKALELAAKANDASGGKSSVILDTLAAAYAETGDFPKALQTAHAALALIESQPNSPFAESLRREIRLYEAGHRFQQKTP